MARLDWVTQLGICYDEYHWGDDPAQVGAPPPMFDRAKLQCFEKHQTVFWDEVHKKCKVGIVDKGGSKQQIRFRRDAEGNLDDNGTLAEEAHYLKMKYVEEMRCCNGVAIYKALDGTLTGVRATPFFYTGQTICTISVYGEAQRKEIARVRSLPGGNCAPWVTGQRVKGDGVFQGDGVIKLATIGHGAESRLATAGIKTIADLLAKAPTEDLRNQLCLAFPGLTAVALKKWFALATKAHVGSFNRVPIDHKQAANPYLSLHGPDDWEDVLAKSSAMSGLRSIKDLVTHMMVESRALMVGSQCDPDKVRVGHDALSLMTCAETRAWMVLMGYDKMWITPQLRCNAGTPFAGRPVGNSPELMPLDCSLNKDVDDSLRLHVVLTKTYAEDDTRKFSFSTPTRLERSYRRVLTGSPIGARIIQDVERCMGPHLRKIIEYKGAVVPNLGSRAGHRTDGSAGINKRGGRRTKRAAPAGGSWVHEDARPGHDLLAMGGVRKKARADEATAAAV
jgi:hypothetical protein